MYWYEDERRIFDRFEANLFIEIQQSSGQKHGSAQCWDISAIGVGLLTEEKLMPNTNLQIRLSIADSNASYRGLAKVVWSIQIQPGKWRCGLEFEQVDFMGIKTVFESLSQHREGRRF